MLYWSSTVRDLHGILLCGALRAVWLGNASFLHAADWDIDIDYYHGIRLKGLLSVYSRVTLDIPHTAIIWPASHICLSCPFRVTLDL